MRVSAISALAVEVATSFRYLVISRRGQRLIPLITEYPQHRFIRSPVIGRVLRTMSGDTNTMYNVIFVLGGPGAGKGTQCERIESVRCFIANLHFNQQFSIIHRPNSIDEMIIQRFLILGQHVFIRLFVRAKNCNEN